MSSIGLRKPEVLDFPIGFGVFFVSMLLTPLTYRLFAPSAPGSAIGDTVQSTLEFPMALRIGQTVVNGFAEEIGCRGYAIERLTELTNSTALSVLAAWAGAILMHIPGWGLRGAASLAAGQLLLIMLYVYQRRLPACFVAHILLDGFPLLVFPALPPSWQWQLARFFGTE